MPSASWHIASASSVPVAGSRRWLSASLGHASAAFSAAQEVAPLLKQELGRGRVRALRQSRSRTEHQDQERSTCVDTAPHRFPLRYCYHRTRHAGTAFSNPRKTGSKPVAGSGLRQGTRFFFPVPLVWVLLGGPWGVWVGGGGGGGGKGGVGGGGVGVHDRSRLSSSRARVSPHGGVIAPIAERLTHEVALHLGHDEGERRHEIGRDEMGPLPAGPAPRRTTYVPTILSRSDWRFAS